MLNIHQEKVTLPDGREILIETGKLAKQADGSVVVRLGDAMLLATVVANKEANEGVDFLPLTVDYREKFSAAGKIPGGFLKREGRPTDDEILAMRIVDRVLRPLFPKDYHCEVQVMIQLISHDPTVMPDALCGLAASAALAITDIPFDGPISEVRVGRIEGQFVINPSREDLERSDIDMVIGATMDSVVMVEGEMKEISEQEMVQAINFAHDAIKPQIEMQQRLAAKVGKSEPKREYEKEIEDEELKNKVHTEVYDKIYDVVTHGTSKQERSDAFEKIYEDFVAQYSEEELEEKQGLVKKYYKEAQKEAVRNCILDQNIRLDGRKSDEIRDIWCEVNYLPNAHGSAIFTRGETQSLTTVTLASKLGANRIDSATFEGEEKFYLHYNFPPFSTGEARPIRGVSRREIGHGNLAQRALKNMVDPNTPYTIRVVSDILESNGSSSMATVCAGTMALMDAGIGMVRPVSGIAMGLISGGDSGKYSVLSDILGDEDFLGDMDFKVCGTEKGITACQMDIKIKGLTYEILEKALLQAKEGRNYILGKLVDTISEARTELKPSVPKMVTFDVPQEFMGAIIGPGGKNIQGLQEATNTTITLEEVDKKIAHVEILGYDQEGIDKAVASIKATCFVPEVGQTYKGKVISIQPYGAFVEIGKGVQGLLHISEIEHKRLNKVEDALEEGQEIEVKLLGIDDKTKKMKLSRKALLPKPDKTES